LFLRSLPPKTVTCCAQQVRTPLVSLWQETDKTVHLIGCWQNLGAVCFWQPIPFWLNLVVVAVLRDRLYYVVYRV